MEEGITVHQICYNFYKLHKEIFKWFISALTNVVEPLEEQTEIAQDIFWSLQGGLHHAGQRGPVVLDPLLKVPC